MQIRVYKVNGWSERGHIGPQITRGTQAMFGRRLLAVACAIAIWVSDQAIALFVVPRRTADTTFCWYQPDWRRQSVVDDLFYTWHLTASEDRFWYSDNNSICSLIYEDYLKAGSRQQY